MLSVIICAHIPRSDYFPRVLSALKVQTLPAGEWELLLIDNASRQCLAELWDLTWHPNARHVREEELGLTPARIRGIQESRGEILVFVDDDNLLADDYLENALNLAERHQHIGAFGGSIIGEFEVPPPDWIKPYLPAFAIYPLERDTWSNVLSWSEPTPYGAGLCVRRNVVQEYLNKITARPERK